MYTFEFNEASYELETDINTIERMQNRNSNKSIDTIFSNLPNGAISNMFTFLADGLKDQSARRQFIDEMKCIAPAMIEMYCAEFFIAIKRNGMTDEMIAELESKKLKAQMMLSGR